MTDYQAKQRQRNIIVGSFVIIALCAFFYMLFRFRALPQVVSQFNSLEILVYFPEAPGVQEDTPVQYCGYQIGRVMKVSPPQIRGDSHKVGVHIAINKRFTDIPEHVDIFVMIRSLGSSYIELRDAASKIGRSDKFLTNESVREDGQVGMANDFFPPEVQAKLEYMVDSITTLTVNMNAIIGDSENQAKLENMVDSITTLSANTNAIIGDSENQANIKKMIANLEATSSQAEATLRSMQNFSDMGTEKVQVIGDKVALAMEQLEGTLSQTRQLLAKIDSGGGTAGKLVNDGRLYENLIESSRELQMLLDQVKRWVDQAQEEGVRIKL